MTLPSGTRLGPYEILAPIGAGGMGEVGLETGPRCRDQGVARVRRRRSRRACPVRAGSEALPGVEVIARGSSTPYRKTRKTPSQIAQELGVGYILTATVRREKSGGSGRVHVTPEFVEVKKAGAPTAKWQHGFDAALTDVFAVQSVIASRVAEALGVALGAGEEKRLSEKPTQNLAASNAYLKGEEIWNGMGDDAPSIRKALALYDQAVALDPAFLQAWARVSWASSILYANSTPTPELAERARSAAEKAIALAPNRPEGYLAFGHYERLVSKDFNRALEQYPFGCQFDGSRLRAPTSPALSRSAGILTSAVLHSRLPI
jgi:hypothetical protein